MVSGPILGRSGPPSGDRDAPRRSIIQEYDLCFTTVDWAPVAKRMEARANGESDAKKARTDGEADEVVEARRPRRKRLRCAIAAAAARWRRE